MSAVATAFADSVGSDIAMIAKQPGRPPPAAPGADPAAGEAGGAHVEEVDVVVEFPEGVEGVAVWTGAAGPRRAAAQDPAPPF